MAYVDGLAWAQNEFAKRALVEILGEDIADRISPDAMLADDLGADSLDMIGLQSILSAKGLDLPDEAFTAHMRVCDLAALIVQPATNPPLGDLARSGSIGGWHPGDDA